MKLKSKKFFIIPDGQKPVFIILFVLSFLFFLSMFLALSKKNEDKLATEIEIKNLIEKYPCSKERLLDYLKYQQETHYGFTGFPLKKKPLTSRVANNLAYDCQEKERENLDKQKTLNTIKEQEALIHTY